MTTQDFQDQHTGTYTDQNGEEWVIEMLNSDLGTITRPALETTLPTTYTLTIVNNELHLKIYDIDYTVGFTDEGLELISGDAVCYNLTYIQ